MSKKCIVCNKVKGKRKCNISNGVLICPSCCASIRDHACGSCSYYKTAKDYQSTKDRKRAAEKSFITEINPEVEERVDYALKLVEEGELKKAEAIIKALEKEHPRNYLVHYGLGIIHIKQDKTDFAIQEWEKAVDIFPPFIEGHFNLANAYKTKFKIPNMVRSYRNVVKYGNEKSDIVKNARDFLKDFEHTTKKASGVDLNTYIIAMEKFDKGFEKMSSSQWQEAAKCFNQSLVYCEASAQAHGNLGLCYAKLGKKSRALNELDRALEIDPDYEIAIVNRMAVANLKEGEALQEGPMKKVDYSLEYSLKGKSYIRELYENLKG